MGRSRVGLSTKIHAVVDADGLPIALQLTPGQAHDGASVRDLRATIAAGQMLLAEAGYDSNALRQTLAARSALACVKPMPNRNPRPVFSAFLYRQRNLVKHFFNKLKHFRAVATRFEMHPESYLALVKHAAARINPPPPVRPLSGRGRPTSRMVRDADHQPRSAENVALSLPADSWETTT
jgi:transposase